ncbi:MAG: site-specific integrase [Desulfovibrionaceae bacterium]|nr:site-specific integrase [Desulfovibrionaceae bacterium]
MPLTQVYYAGSFPGRAAGRTPGEATDRGSLKSFVELVYFPHIRLRKRSWQLDERIAGQYIFPAFGECSLTALRRSAVETWLHGLAGRGLSPATCNRIFAVFRSVCSLAVAHGIIARSPCAGVPPFKICRHRERFLSPDEAARLMAALGRSSRPEACALRLLLLTGARKSEILRARWENLSNDWQLLTAPLSKSGRPRHIFLSEEAAAAIRSLPRRPGSPWLFPGRSPDRPLSDIYRFWDGLRRELGLTDVRIHDLRHSFASFLVNTGHSLYEVQTLLGHSDPRITMRYAHLERGTLLAAVQSVGSCLAQARPGENGNPPAHPPLPPAPASPGSGPCGSLAPAQRQPYFPPGFNRPVSPPPAPAARNENGNRPHLPSVATAAPAVATGVICSEAYRSLHLGQLQPGFSPEHLNKAVYPPAAKAGNPEAELAPPEPSGYDGPAARPPGRWKMLSLSGGLQIGKGCLSLCRNILKVCHQTYCRCISVKKYT